MHRAIYWFQTILGRFAVLSSMIKSYEVEMNHMQLYIIMWTQIDW